MRSSYPNSIWPPPGLTAITRRASASMPVTSAMTHWTFLCPLSTLRKGAAICPSDRMPVAHW